VKSTHSLDDLKNYLETKDILLGGYKGDYMRFVCHNDIEKQDIDTFIKEVHIWLDSK
jgi:threonine aldolase